MSLAPCRNRCFAARRHQGAMLFAWLVLGEAIDGRDLLGVIPVALGIYLVTRPAAVPAPAKIIVAE